jgi:hypothetical protein
MRGCMKRFLLLLRFRFPKFGKDTLSKSISHFNIVCHPFGLTDIPIRFKNITLESYPNKDILGETVLHAFIDFLFSPDLFMPMCSPFKRRYPK